jgi:hypothetical protein
MGLPVVGSAAPLPEATPSPPPQHARARPETVPGQTETRGPGPRGGRGPGGLVEDVGAGDVEKGLLQAHARAHTRTHARTDIGFLRALLLTFADSSL